MPYLQYRPARPLQSINAQDGINTNEVWNNMDSSGEAGLRHGTIDWLAGLAGPGSCQRLYPLVHTLVFAVPFPGSVYRTAMI